MHRLNIMRNIKKSKIKKSKTKKQKTNRTKLNEPSFRPDVIEEDFCTLFSQEWTKNAAKITGLIKRERKMEAFIMLNVLVFSFGTHLPRNIANMKRKYEKASKKDIVDSSWYERFTPELVEFLKLCVTHAIEQLAQEQNKVLNEKLAKFKDVLSKDRILLIDLGFFKHQLFARIKDNGGYFVSRLKASSDPLIVEVHNVCRGNSIDVKGKYISEILSKLKRQILDVEVEISFKRRKYNGKEKLDTERFRLVAIFNVEEEKYHVYLTNILNEDLGSEDVAKLYGARWDIELIFKELKSRYDLVVINTKNPQIIEAYIWISILTLLISRRIYNIVRKHSPKEKMVRYTQLRWSTIFTENASDQLTLILRYYGVDRTFETIMNVYQSQALDPHVNRERFRDEFWS